MKTLKIIGNFDFRHLSQIFCIIIFKPVLNRLNYTGYCTKYSPKIIAILPSLFKSESSKTAPPGEDVQVINSTPSRIRPSEFKRVMEERITRWRQGQVHMARALREYSHGCSLPQKCRPKAQELYSDQPGKSPADVTLG